MVGESLTHQDNRAERNRSLQPEPELHVRAHAETFDPDVEQQRRQEEGVFPECAPAKGVERQRRCKDERDDAGVGAAARMPCEALDAAERNPNEPGFLMIARHRFDAPKLPAVMARDAGHCDDEGREDSGSEERLMAPPRDGQQRRTREQCQTQRYQTVPVQAPPLPGEKGDESRVLRHAGIVAEPRIRGPFPWISRLKPGASWRSLRVSGNFFVRRDTTLT